MATDFECFDTGGEPIRRIGVATMKRILKDLVNATDEGDDVWASVSCPDAGVYMARYDKEYSITHLDRDNKIILDEDCKRDEGIKLFLKIREDEKREGKPEDE